MLELLVLGAGPAYSDQPGSVGSAYLVRDGADAIVMDLAKARFPHLAHSVEPSELLAASSSATSIRTISST